MVSIVSRQTWGALPANRTIYTIVRSRRTGFVVHHSVSGTGSNAAGAMALIRGFQRLHQSNGWGDIGYNFLIDAWGNIYEGRGLNAIGAHAGNHNTLNLGVCYIGDGRTGEMPDAAKQAFRNLYAWANGQTGKTLTCLVHSDLNSTACPGPFIRNWVKSGALTGSGITPASTPTETPTPPPTQPLPERDATMTTLYMTTVPATVPADDLAFLNTLLASAPLVTRAGVGLLALCGDSPNTRANVQLTQFDLLGNQWAADHTGSLDVARDGLAMGKAARALQWPHFVATLRGYVTPLIGSVGGSDTKVLQAISAATAAINANVDQIPLSYTITAK